MESSEELQPRVPKRGTMADNRVGTRNRSSGTMLICVVLRPQFAAFAQFLASHLKG